MTNTSGPHPGVNRTVEAVVRRMPLTLLELSAPVTCLIGPPGSGKTMLLEVLRSPEPDRRARPPLRHVITVDDADSGDPLRLRQLRSLIDHTRADTSLRVAVAVRKLSLGAEVTCLLRRTDAVFVEIPPLTLNDVGAIAEQFVAGPVSALTVHELHHLSMGRPALLHHLLTANRGTGRLHDEAGGWRLGDEPRLGNSYLYLDGPDPEALPLPEQRAEQIVAAVEQINYATLVGLTSRSAVDSLITRRVLHLRPTATSDRGIGELDFRQPLRRLVIRRSLGPEHLLHLRGQPATPGDSHPTPRGNPDALRSSEECAGLLIGAAGVAGRTTRESAATDALSPVARGIAASGLGAIDCARQTLQPALRQLARTPEVPSLFPALWGTAYLAHLTADSALAAEVRGACRSVPSVPQALRLLAEAWSAPPDSPPDAHVGALLRARDALGDCGLVELADYVSLDLLGTGCAPGSIHHHPRPRLSPLSHLVDQTFRALRGHDVQALAGLCRDFDDERPTVIASILIAVTWRLALRTGTRDLASQLRHRLDVRVAAAPQISLPVLRPTAHDRGLSSREDQILALVAQGLTNREIAQTLTLSVRTVEGHVYRALRRLGLHARGELGTAALSWTLP